MIMHLQRGDHNTGPSLLNLVAYRRIEIHQPDFSALHGVSLPDEFRIRIVCEFTHRQHVIPGGSHKLRSLSPPGTRLGFRPPQHQRVPIHGQLGLIFKTNLPQEWLGNQDSL
jgi:hypothetical protein